MCIYWGTTETLFLLLHALFILACLHAFETKTAAAFFGSGILLGMATLCRAVTLLMPPFVLPALLVQRDIRPRRSLAMWAALLLGFTAAVGPWIGRNYIVFSRFIPVQTLGGLHLYMASANHDDIELPQVSGVHSDRELYRRAIDRIVADPWEFVQRMGRRAVCIWYASHSERHTSVLKVVNFSLLGVAAVGAVLMRRQWRRLALLYCTFLYYVALHSVIFGIFRYMLPTVPILMLLASVPLALLLAKCRSHRSPADAPA
jgi:hypothetical protein